MQCLTVEEGKYSACKQYALRKKEAFLKMSWARTATSLSFSVIARDIVTALSLHFMVQKA